MSDIDLKDFVKLVQDMRNAQKSFFRTASQGRPSEKQATLELSKKLEREVDAKIDDMLNNVPDNQKTLF